jgi:hypothetical protein
MHSGKTSPHHPSYKSITFHRNFIEILRCFFFTIQEPRWQVGKLYTPADAVAQRLKSLSLSDIRILATTISDWFKRFED